MRNIIFAILSGMLALSLTSCGDDDDDADTDTDSGSEVTETAKADMPGKYCDALIKCDSPVLTTVGGAENCEKNVGELLFSEALCPNADYDAVLATDCASEVKSLSCDEISEAAGTMTFPDVCNQMCGAP